jgi:hypothetical protein
MVKLFIKVMHERPGYRDILRVQCTAMQECPAVRYLVQHGSISCGNIHHNPFCAQLLVTVRKCGVINVARPCMRVSIDNLLKRTLDNKSSRTESILLSILSLNALIYLPICEGGNLSADCAACPSSVSSNDPRVDVQRCKVDQSGTRPMAAGRPQSLRIIVCT